MKTLSQIFAAANSVIPVVTLTRAEDIEPLADVLADAGFPVVEITLRTPAGIEAIGRLARVRPELIVGAGTVLGADAAVDAANAGASFIVSPGFADDVHDFALANAIAYLPGVATVTEIMAAHRLGYRHLKLFPAAVAGGTAMLAAVASVLPAVTFCPTGGVSRDNLTEFLGQPNVGCVGGSWLTPSAHLEARDWPEISRIARQTAEIVGGFSG